MVFLAGMKSVPESMQLSAIRQNVLSLLTIKKPTKRVLLEAVDIDPFIIRNIIEPDEDVQIRAISNNGKVLQYIKNPTKKVQSEAVKLYGYEILKYIHAVDEDIQLAALEEDVENVNYIDVLGENAQRFYESIKDKFLPEYHKEISQIKEGETRQYILFDNNIDGHLNYLCEKLFCSKLSIAVGFMFNSGLQMIEHNLRRILADGGKVEIIVGSLQKYFNDSNIVDMNVETAQAINNLINCGMSVSTYTDRFYHGKIYILEGVQLDAIIMGSSNLSSSGFRNNKELNTLCLCGKKSQLGLSYRLWYEKFLKDCREIQWLETSKFNKYENEIHITSTLNITKVDIDYVKGRIKGISDEELAKRLTIWLSKKPNNQYIDLGVFSLNEYVLFEYKEYDLIVLEALKEGNSFFYFYGYSVDGLLDEIRFASKNEIFRLSNMGKRGYHIRNIDKLEQNIQSIFFKRASKQKE